MRRTLKLITEATSEPVTSAEAKAWARIDTTADDSLVAALITSARQEAEVYTGRSFLSTTWDLILDAARVDPDRRRLLSDIRPDSGIPSVIELPRAPLVSVTAVYATDVDDIETTVASTVYRADANSEPGRIALKTGQVWPEVREHGSLRVRYIAGYGSAAAVPGPIKTAILMIVATRYENRENVIVGTISSALPAGAAALLDAYRLRRI